MQYCLLILNCSKYEYKRQRQINTWLKDFPIDLWFQVRGNPLQSEEYIFDTSNHILTVNIPDDYVSLCKKTYTALKAIYETYPHVSHVLKTDDDMDCNITNYMKLSKLFSNFDYGGFLVEHKNDHWSTYHYHDSIEKKPALCRKTNYANGRFYFISRRGVKHILTYRELFWDSMFEDNTVGFALQSLSNITILPIHDKLIFFEYPDYVSH